jgi:hypothetical protein
MIPPWAVVDDVIDVRDGHAAPSDDTADSG